jgi:hypothetical protein
MEAQIIRRQIAFAACLLVHVAPVSASATLYGIDYVADNLITIDTATGAATIVGALGFEGVHSLAYDSRSGMLYGVDNALNQLITIDRTTGAGTAVGPIGARNVQGLAFDSAGTLYGVEYGVDLALDVLFTINTATGAATVVGPLGFTAVSSLAYDSSSGILYGVDYIRDQLITINATTGAATAVGTAPGTAGPGNVVGLTFSPSGTLYAAVAFPDQLLTIDTATGTATVVGPVGVDGLDALAFTDGVSLVGVDIDVKPGVDSKCLGTLPVAILGSDTLDVTEIDQTTLSFEGLSVREKGDRAPSCNIKDVDGDGYLDLICQYQDTTTDGILNGQLLDGTPIEGSDTICVAR